MRMRVLISTALLGVIAAFVGFALDWSTTAYGEVTYEMPGETSTIVVGAGGESSDAREAGHRVREYVESNGIALLVGSTGDGLPRLVASDPDQAVPWLAQAEVGPGDVLVFDGTYSHRVRRSSGEIPFLPVGVHVRGHIHPPGGIGDLQYVQILEDDAELVPGAYVVNTRDPDVVEGLIAILADAGLQVHDSRGISYVEYLIHEPLIGVTVALFGFGLLATVAHWTMLSLSGLPESRIRRQHGALTSDLARRELVRRAPWIAGGTVLGVGVAIVTVVTVGSGPLTPVQWRILVVSGAAVLTVGALVSAVGTYLALRTGPEGNDVA